jgi:phosphatidylserine/phosphatidylglycerophosphate/cardiolipin synthase-like enzyme
MLTKKTITYLLTLVITILLLVNLPIHTNSSVRLLRQILTTKNGQILHAFFSPHDNIRETIVNLIENEQSAIKVASYFFTDDKIAKALINAHQRAVSIEIITDQKHLETCPHTKIFELSRAGIKIVVFQNQNKYGIFHHKFIWFANNFNNAPMLTTGSFNFTSAAQEQNQENVIITDSPDITAKYLTQFSKLQTQSQPISKFIKKHNLGLA